MIVLQADKHPMELGALSESTILEGRINFPEISQLTKNEQVVLLDAAVVKFIEHAICFREILGNDAILIFPNLIKQKRPLVDDIGYIDDVSYIIKGKVENVYPTLVVLLGYTNTFTRVNQWHRQAQYILGKNEICGFRLTEDRDSEIEFVLYYSEDVPDHVKHIFQGLFEKFLYQQNVDVERFKPVTCKCNHRQERSTVIKRSRENKQFVCCEECGTKILLPDSEKFNVINNSDGLTIRREEAYSRLKRLYEASLVSIKSFRKDRKVPRCFISNMADNVDFVEKLKNDLSEAGIILLKNSIEISREDIVIIIDGQNYRKYFHDMIDIIGSDPFLIKKHNENFMDEYESIICINLSNLPVFNPLKKVKSIEFSKGEQYLISLFELVLRIYAVPSSNLFFTTKKEKLANEYEIGLGNLDKYEKNSEEISIDVVILTVLKEEFEAIKNQIGNMKQAPRKSNSPDLYAWQIGTVKSPHGEYSVALGLIGRAGNTKSALATSNSQERWNPRYIFFVGIAGGLNNKNNSINLGDVIIADVIHGYEYGKLESSFSPRADWTYKTDQGLLTGALAHDYNEFKNRITLKSPKKRSIQVHCGEIASGDKVIDDPSNEFFNSVLMEWPKIIAVEMEGAGVGHAIEYLNDSGKSVGFMMIRGISDLPRINEKAKKSIQGTAERDSWKVFAANSAAAFTVSYISKGLPTAPKN